MTRGIQGWKFKVVAFLEIVGWICAVVLLIGAAVILLTGGGFR